ncbi:hypothetical protein AB1Y20_003180 [Prymnesium parvum]|uniref:SGNH hydrolase-type esterase domain-containing protein n=1 Tax=Prymnesium parvum TaxID=97485 RepID=A0AB34JCQ2_PRYPA
MAVSTRGFFREYHGHPVHDLEVLVERLPRSRGIAFLVGDSSFDNKYWINRQAEVACNGYEDVLDVPRCVPDVAFWVNHELMRVGLGYELCCVNAAVEEATLGLHAGGRLLPQDELVRARLCAKDVLVTSIGGNDVALRPSAATVVSMLALLLCPKWLIESGFAPGLGHFVDLFGRQTRKYIESLITPGREPRLVVCCMLYYLDMKPGGSWADNVLEKLGYNKDPEKLQLLLRKVYELGIQKITLKNIPVITVPMYEALDGTDTEDYVQRVEPSSQGGKKIARLIVGRIKDALAKLPKVAPSSPRKRSSSSESPRSPTVAMPPPTHAKS